MLTIEVCFCSLKNNLLNALALTQIPNRVVGPYFLWVFLVNHPVPANAHVTIPSVHKSETGLPKYAEIVDNK